MKQELKVPKNQIKVKKKEHKMQGTDSNEQSGASNKDSSDTSKDQKEETKESNKTQSNKGEEDTSKETESPTKLIENPAYKPIPIPEIEKEIAIEEAIERAKIGISFRQINRFKFISYTTVKFFFYGLISYNEKILKYSINSKFN